MLAVDWLSNTNLCFKLWNMGMTLILKRGICEYADPKMMEGLKVETEHFYKFLQVAYVLKFDGVLQAQSLFLDPFCTKLLVVRSILITDQQPLVLVVDLFFTFL